MNIYRVIRKQPCKINYTDLKIPILKKKNNVSVCIYISPQGQIKCPDFLSNLSKVNILLSKAH